MVIYKKDKAQVFSEKFNVKKKFNASDRWLENLKMENGLGTFKQNFLLVRSPGSSYQTGTTQYTVMVEVVVMHTGDSTLENIRENYCSGERKENLYLFFLFFSH